MNSGYEDIWTMCKEVDLANSEQSKGDFTVEEVFQNRNDVTDKFLAKLSMRI